MKIYQLKDFNCRKLLMRERDAGSGDGAVSATENKQPYTNETDSTRRLIGRLGLYDIQWKERWQDRSVYKF